MRTAFVTMANKRFAVGLSILTYSIKKNAPLFWNHVDEKILLTTDIDKHPDYKTVKVDPYSYRYWGSEKFAVNCCKLELFKFRDFDRIIFYEGDTLCLGELDDLLSNKYFYGMLGELLNLMGA